MFHVGWQEKLCDPLDTHGPYLSALETKGLYIKCCINLSVYYTFTVLHTSLVLSSCSSLPLNSAVKVVNITILVLLPIVSATLFEY